MKIRQIKGNRDWYTGDYMPQSLTIEINEDEKKLLIVALESAIEALNNSRVDEVQDLIDGRIQKLAEMRQLLWSKMTL